MPAEVDPLAVVRICECLTEFRLEDEGCDSEDLGLDWIEVHNISSAETRYNVTQTCSRNSDVGMNMK